MNIEIESILIFFEIFFENFWKILKNIVFKILENLPFMNYYRLVKFGILIYTFNR